MNETCCDQGQGVWISNGKIVTTSPSATTQNQPVQSTSTSLSSTTSSITISVYSVIPTNQPIQSASTSLGSATSSITNSVNSILSTPTSSSTPALSESAKVGLGVGVSISVLIIAVLIYHHYWTRRHLRLTPGLAAATLDKNTTAQTSGSVPPNPMQYQQHLPVSEVANNMVTQQYSQHPVSELPNNAAMQYGVPQQSHGYEAHGGNAWYELPARNG
jgi:hypothetical protein